MFRKENTYIYGKLRWIKRKCPYLKDQVKRSSHARLQKNKKNNKIIDQRPRLIKTTLLGNISKIFPSGVTNFVGGKDSWEPWLKALTNWNRKKTNNSHEIMANIQIHKV